MFELTWIILRRGELVNHARHDVESIPLLDHRDGKFGYVELVNRSVESLRVADSVGHCDAVLSEELLRLPDHFGLLSLEDLCFLHLYQDADSVKIRICTGSDPLKVSRTNSISLFVNAPVLCLTPFLSTYDDGILRGIR